VALRRRDLFVFAGVLALAASVSPLLRYLNSGFEFVPIEGLEGFRRLDQGPVSSGPAVLVGLDGPSEALLQASAEFLQNPCRSLFGADVWREDRLPIAVFSDYYCPYCATLSRRLKTIADTDGRIDLVIHELPLLGPRSIQAAKIALAAAQQGEHLEAHMRLMGTSVRPGPTGLRSFATALELDPERLAADLRSDEVLREMNRTAAMAQVLGIIGTPGTMIGQTLVVGAISAKDIKTLIDLERSRARSSGA
jgi:protein-disulfide isomerase